MLARRIASAPFCWAVLLLAVMACAARAADAPKTKAPDPSEVFFDVGPIPNLRIEIAPAELRKLRLDNRPYVHATLEENGKTKYADVAVKLKGAAGSFRPFEDRPALTINSDKFKPNQMFHGMDKFHLNNSVQDDSYLNELVSAELFKAAGVPAARVTHARVWLNGRDVGLYVLKEGFDKSFLKHHFSNADGNLYDGGFCQEIDANLNRTTGDGPDDHSDLKALVAACQEPDQTKRFEQMAACLDVERFISFMAMELMTCHWDGYCQSRNNYRVYFKAKSHQAIFFPHGMDQMFSDSHFSVLDQPGALVASSLMQNPAWRQRYRQRLNELVKLFDPPTALLKRVDEVSARLRPVLAGISPELAREHSDRVRDLKARLVARSESLIAQNKQKEPSPQEFDAKGEAKLVDWYQATDTGDAELAQADLDGKKTYTVKGGPSQHCVASWRAKVLLTQGNYKLVGTVRTSGVSPLGDAKGIGAGLRISGSDRSNQLSGTAAFKTLEYQFTVAEPARLVVLVAELRASRGQAWFDADSLKLIRLKQ